MSRVVVVGGGAAGFFAAINTDQKVILLEKTATLLAKVRISGGGRCNVTHCCFEPRELVKNYPRGHKALLGPFHHFQPQDTISWFEERGVQLKKEKDGRMFPVTDSSDTIIQSLTKAASGVDIRLRQRIRAIEKKADRFTISLDEGQIECDKLLLATGSSHQGYTFAKQLGHTLIEPVPSLFTFNVPASPLKELSGVSVQNAHVKIIGTSFEQTGPLLITHWGFSGPAVLKLSAWAARYLYEKNYLADIEIDWAPDYSELDKKPPEIPKRLFKALDGKKKSIFHMEGKTTYKEEFVTAGGVDLDEVNFRTMESRICPGLYFAGEILDIDGVTGGFNFQSAWTTGYLAAKSF